VRPLRNITDLTLAIPVSRSWHLVVTKAAATSSESSSGWSASIQLWDEFSDADCPHAVLLEEPVAAARYVVARDVSRAGVVEPDAPVAGRAELRVEVVEPDAPVVGRAGRRAEVAGLDVQVEAQAELRVEVVEPDVPVVGRSGLRAEVAALGVPVVEPGVSRAGLSGLDVLVAAWAGCRVRSRAWAPCAWAAAVPPAFQDELEDGLQAAQVRGGRAQPVHSDAAAVLVGGVPAAPLALRAHWALLRVCLAAHRVSRPVCWGVPAHSV
jgi:hypothetical protein